MCGTVDTMKKIIAGSFSNMKKIITNKICYRTVNTIYYLKKKKKKERRKENVVFLVWEEGDYKVYAKVVHQAAKYTYTIESDGLHAGSIHQRKLMFKLVFHSIITRICTQKKKKKRKKTYVSFNHNPIMYI